MKKIRLIVNAIPLTNIKTGIGRYIQELYCKLEDTGELDIYYFDGQSISKDFPLSPNLQQWSWQVDLFWKLPSYLAYLIRVCLHIKRERIFFRLSKNFDLYHETAFFPFKTKLPTVFTIHDLSVLRFPQYHPRERVLYFKTYFKKRLQQTKFILSVSEFTKKEIITYLGYPAEKIKVTYLGYNEDIFKTYPPQQTLLTLKKYKIKEPFFVFIGTNDPRKNLDFIKKCALHSQYPIYVIGWQGWRDKDFGPNFIPLGYIAEDKEVAHILNRATGLIYPSLYEGFGLPVLEAMACGCPVIISPKSSLPEIAEDAAIYIQDFSKIQDLLNIMCKLVEDKAYWQGYSNRVKTRATKFSWKYTAKETLEIFKLIKNKGDNICC